MPNTNDAKRRANPTPDRPHVPAERVLPELTVKAIALGAVLAVLLAGANAYLGLLAGMTVSASIPAAVISMAVLRLFRRSNILENNIVQTAASAGESLAAGVIFTFPALIILGAWEDFNYVTTTIIAGLGGLLGVLFTVPLRRALVVESNLTFPEGVATAEVLKVGERAREEGEGGEEDLPASGGAGIGPLIGGATIGALFKLGGTGLNLWTATAETAARVGGSIAYFGSSLLPALVAVGFIVGLNIAVLVFLGGAINWFVAIPIYAAASPWPEGASAGEFAWEIWSTKTRYIGVGAMVVGGLWALLRLWGSLVAGVRSGIEAYRTAKDQDAAELPRTERDTPLPWVAIALVIAVVPLYFVFSSITDHAGVSILMAVVMIVAGFLFCAVASYMAGLVGSSNNPISGVTIATLLFSSLLLFFLMGQEWAIGPAAAILIGAVVACAAAIGGDNMQDLKAGHLLGATPKNQQVMQAVGVVAGALVMAPILSVLLSAYGIVEPVSPDRAPLPAPQATLMASVARGVFAQDLPWTMVWIGMAIAVAVIVLDVILERAGSAFRTPVLAVAVGIYLPLELSVPIFAGGLIAWGVNRFHLRRGQVLEAEGRLETSLDDVRQAGLRRGLLFAAGLITGEAILGILLAIPIVLMQGENPLQVSEEAVGFDLPLVWPGIVLLIAVMAALAWVASRRPAGGTG